MGQKTHPIGFRLAFNKNWRSVWHDDKRYARLLEKDTKIREFLYERLQSAGVEQVNIYRSIGHVDINITVARPGLVIGRGGQNIEELKRELNRMIEEKYNLNVQEVPNPNFSARLVANNIARSIERRYPYKRAVRSNIRKVVEAGVKGIKVVVSGRLSGGTIARREKFHEGTIPTSTLAEEIDFAIAEAKTKYGTIGIKVWITPGESE